MMYMTKSDIKKHFIFGIILQIIALMLCVGSVIGIIAMSVIEQAGEASFPGWLIAIVGAAVVYSLVSIFHLNFLSQDFYKEI